MQQAMSIFQRLTEVEKITLRLSTDDGIGHLANTSFVVDMPNASPQDRTATLKEVQAIAMLTFAAASARTDYGHGLAF